MASNTILLLEDDQPLREYYSLNLEANNYEVIQAENSEQIIELIEKHQPALIITDLVMPDHDGLEGIFKLIGKYQIPVMVISAYPEFIQLSKPVVAATYLKPLSAEEFIRAVANLLAPPTASNTVR
ncbi:MAG: response regulator [Sedimenticola sp.]|uniref:Response regulator n=1 Tax=Sedimenticola thiotaurini TaxID=1543721 RepID=A0A558DFB1_9GAMM|nr:response regulator [Sedimenticola sp.]MCW8921392.1 response regulator [Sedimenticola sp.]MCW8947622.1 response regulator [Sedimenticola sp.]TVT59710.1 MAG: response regulator [Sedimenticola thiotaurini]